MPTDSVTDTEGKSNTENKGPKSLATFAGKNANGTSGQENESEETILLNQKVEQFVDDMVATGDRESSEPLRDITPGENRAINRFINSRDGELYRGKYTGGKHIMTGKMVNHALDQHKDIMKEALRASLPVTVDDIKKTLSAIASGKGIITKPSRTEDGKPSILTVVPVNGYTYYAEAIIQNKGNGAADLKSNTIWKAPTQGPANSPVSLSRELSARSKTSAGDGKTVPYTDASPLSLYSYYTQSGQEESTVKFVSKDGKAARLYYTGQGKGRPVHARAFNGLVFLSADPKNIKTAPWQQTESGYGKPIHYH